MLPRSTPEALGLDPARLEQLYALVERHVADGPLPRRAGRGRAARPAGRLADVRPGAPEPAPVDAGDDTLWLLYSQTKPIVAAAVWQLVDHGAISFADRVSEHVPEFARHGKGDVTVHQVLTHQGGFPTARAGLRWRLGRPRPPAPAVCDFTLEWTPGSRVHYHAAARRTRSRPS